MRFETPLDEVLRSRSHVRILRALIGLPAGYAATTRDIARRAGISHPTASRILSALAEQGLVSSEHVGRADLHRCNDEHVLVNSLRALFAGEDRLRTELEAFLSEQLRRRLGRARIAAYLFGSAARGPARSGSDIDVALVAPGRSETDLEPDLSAVADAVRKRFGNELNFVVGSADLEELQEPRAPGHALWQRIAKEGVPLSSAPARRTTARA